MGAIQPLSLVAEEKPLEEIVHQSRLEASNTQMHINIERAIERGEKTKARNRAATRFGVRVDALSADLQHREEEERQRVRELERQQAEEEAQLARDAAAHQAEHEREAEVVTEQAPQESAPAPAVTSGVPWDLIAKCESGYGGEPNWSINTGNGFYGGLQFDKSSWDWAGGQQYAEYPHQASREQQIATAEKLLGMHPAGLGAWPACTKKLGLR